MAGFDLNGILPKYQSGVISITPLW